MKKKKETRSTRRMCVLWCCMQNRLKYLKFRSVPVPATQSAECGDNKHTTQKDKSVTSESSCQFEK